MPAAIGIRIYRLWIGQRGSRIPISFSSSSIEKHPKAFTDDFIASHSAPIQNEGLERTWYFEKKATNATEISGYIKYGTFGFESDLVDSRTKRNNYKRKTTDVEEIPLFFEFWFPLGANFALLAFQSFQGRSCISIVTAAMKDRFEKTNRDCVMHFWKLMPSNLKGSLFLDAPVKRVRLICRNAPTDKTDRYFPDLAAGSIDLEVRLTATRKSSLGKLGSIVRKIPKEKTGILEQDGIEFNQAYAEINFAGKMRKVGMFGVGGDTGLIDITESVEKGINGHPTINSVRRETRAFLKDFYETLSRRAK